MAVESMCVPGVGALIATPLGRLSLVEVISIVECFFPDLDGCWRVNQHGSTGLADNRLECLYPEELVMHEYKGLRSPLDWLGTCIW
jgi:hypothetical protein